MVIGKLLGYDKKKSADKYPGFNRRMAAITIDSILLLVFLPIINRLAPVHNEALANFSPDSNDPNAASHLIAQMLSDPVFVQSWTINFFMQMLFWCVYSAICLHFWSATPGKMLLRMKVVDNATEGRISDIQVVTRSFGYMVSTLIFCLGFIWINFNKRHRGWHDYLGDTVVIGLPLMPKMPWQKKPATAEAAEGEPEKPAEPIVETPLEAIATETDSI